MAELDAFEESLETGETPRSIGRQKQSRRWVLVFGIVTLLLVVAGFGFFYQTQMGDAAKKKAAQIAGQGLSPEEQKAKETEKKKKNRKVKYAVLYSQLTQSQAAEVTRELSYENIDFNVQQNGKNYGISVDEEHIDEAKMSLALKGVPFGTAQGYQLLDGGQTLGVTEFDKRVRFVRALSGELENAIRNMDAVETCRVQVVLPEQRLFAVTQPPVTAAVMVRKREGGELTDSVVFSIIQYVSSAVENLQPENVTVVDMVEGKVLSDGIFERIAAGQAAKKVPELAEGESGVTAEPAPENARPVIPDFDEIQQWYEVKEKYEQALIERATKQLVGVLPVGSFKIAITADLGPLDNGEVVEIKRLTTSIVVDNSRDDIFLEADLKSEIFNTIAASIGYVRGRDMILLNRADFSLMTPEEKAKLEASLKAKSAIRTGLVVAGGLIGCIVAFLILRRLLLLLGTRGKKPSLVDTKAVKEGGLISKEVSPRETDFASLQLELDKEKRFDPVRQVADTDPEILARIMEDWLADAQPSVRF